MESRDRSPDVEPGTPAGVPGDDPAITSGPGRAAALWSAALAAGLAAGIAAWLIDEATREFIKPEEVETTINNRTGRNSTLDTIDAATVKQAMLAFGILGAAVGLALGAGGGLVRRSARAAAVAAAVGLIAGGVAGVGAAAAILPPVLRAENFQEDTLLRPFLIHAGVWGPLGVAGGLAFGLGAGHRRGQLLVAALGGGLGALFGTIAYELIGGLAFPFARTDRVFSLTSETRLIARLCVALGVAAGAALLLRDRRGTNHRAPRPS